MRVLIIEDHTGVRVALKMLLELEGFSAFTAEDGEHALDYLSNESVDAILLDLRTGGMSAPQFWHTLMELLQKQERPRPILGVLSGSSKLQEEASALGADFVLSKPFDHNDLIRRLREIPWSGTAENI